MPTRGVPADRFRGTRHGTRELHIRLSNLVFSQWDRVFKDPMTTAAAIDRVVHHATILELTAKRSVRGEEAKRRNAALAKKSAPKK